MTIRKYRRYLAMYNDLFFSGKLVCKLEFKNMNPNTLGTYKDIPGGFVIILNKKYISLETNTLMTLLHEMVHVELPKTAKHGPRFQARMKQLAEQDAFERLW